MRLICVLASILLCASVSPAEYSVGYTEDGYTYAGAGYWQNAEGTYFTRSYVEYPGYQTSYYYGRYYQTPVTYYYYKYTRANKAVSSLTPKSSDAEWIDFLKQRERIQGKIAQNEQEKNAFIERLNKVGVSPPFAGAPFPSSGSGGYYGAFTGNTLYGYGTSYTFSQTADIYGTIDPNILMQGSVALAKAARESATQANTETNTILSNVTAGAERMQQARIDGEQRLKAQQIEADLAKARFEAARPPNRVTTNVTTTTPPVGTTPLPTVPNTVLPNDGPFTERYVKVVKANCIQCHSGKDAKGGFDMTSKVLTDVQKAKVFARVTLPASDPKHMPAGEGKPGKQLSAQEVHDVLD
jgi:hypothetical protein